MLSGVSFELMKAVASLPANPGLWWVFGESMVAISVLGRAGR